MVLAFVVPAFFIGLSVGLLAIGIATQPNKPVLVENSHQNQR